MAASWTYSDYLTMSGAARLTRLNLHIKEVADRLAGWSQMAASGNSGSRFQLQEYLDSLKDEARSLEGALGTSNTAGAVRVPFTRGRSM